MRNYTAQKYESLVEGSSDRILRQFMKDELSFIRNTPNLSARCVIDLGAGHGRAVSGLASFVQSMVAVEINPEMFQELQKRASAYTNVTAVLGDFLKINKLLPEDLENPIFLILQNSLGTIEGGDFKDVIKVVKQELKEKHGQLILSLFRQPKLGSYGVSMYEKLRDMVGSIDYGKSDFDRGLFVTDTGYISKWWTDDEIEGFKKIGKLEDEIVRPEYWILRLSS